MVEKHCILNAGPVDEGFRSRFGDYASLFIRMLSSPSVKFEIFDVHRNEFPSSLADYSVIYITGSRYGAHEDVEFIRKLSHIIRTIVNEHPAKKLVGICFGHQLIAHSLGGLSGPSADEVGWELGLKPLRFERGALQAVFPSLGPSFLEQACSETKPLQILQVHRDQVKRLPPQATLVASSTKTAFEVYALGKQVLCFQGHPEFSPEVVSYLLQTKEALQLLPQNATIPLYSPDNEVFVKLIRNFTQPARSRL